MTFFKLEISTKSLPDLQKCTLQTQWICFELFVGVILKVGVEIRSKGALKSLFFSSTYPWRSPVQHIQPKLYFLFAYCILRSIPKKYVQEASAVNGLTPSERKVFHEKMDNFFFKLGGPR
jgi:hypothetical protein